uniref:Uncharacterized protein n=1 Tax=Anguilla anguilla TaxID=7936 RepID=A0A0E9XRF0_ANGAN
MPLNTLGNFKHIYRLDGFNLLGKEGQC